MGEQGICFEGTTKGDSLYAIASAWPNGEAVIASLATGRTMGRIAGITLLGHSGELEFLQDEHGLKIELPAEHPDAAAWSFKITGLKAR